MSEPLKYAIAVCGFVVIVCSYVVIAWKTADRAAHKEVTRLTPPSGAGLSDTASGWLTARIVQRTRWSALATGVADAVLIPIVLAFHDVPLIDEAGGMTFLFAVGVGYVVGATLATAASARIGVGTQRSAPLDVRSLRHYLRVWEHRLQKASVAVAALCVALTAWLWSSDVLDAVYPVLAVSWLSLAIVTVWLQRWVVRTPLVVDEELHAARELNIAISVRSLGRFQAVWAALIAFVGATYASLHSDLPWIVGVAPLYVAGAAGIALRIADSARRDRGSPAAEWYFARTLGPAR